jgi:hypothetical protein
MKMVVLLGIRLNSHGMFVDEFGVKRRGKWGYLDQVLSGCVLAAGCVPPAGCVLGVGSVPVAGWAVAGCVLVAGWGAGTDCILADACGLVVDGGLMIGCAVLGPGLLGVVWLLEGWKLRWFLFFFDITKYPKKAPMPARASARMIQ